MGKHSRSRGQRVGKNKGDSWERDRDRDRESYSKKQQHVKFWCKCLKSERNTGGIKMKRLLDRRQREECVSGVSLPNKFSWEITAGLQRKSLKIWWDFNRNHKYRFFTLASNEHYFQHGDELPPSNMQ